MGVAAGEQLREARELKGLTVEDVAARLKVPARYVRALEEGDVAALPEPTFVRGYVKAYARALGLDPEPLVAQLAPVEVKAPKPLVAVDGGTSTRKATAARAPNFRSTGSRRRYGAMLAGVVVLAVVVVMVLALRDRHPAAVATTSAALPAPAGGVTPVAPSMPAPVVAPSSAGQAVTMEIQLPAPPAAALPAPPASGPSPAPAASITGGTAAVSLPLPAPAVPVPVVAPTPAATPATAAAPAEGDIPRHGLHIRFRGQSWVEVRDADNVVLHTSVQVAGGALSLDGKAPLSVTFNDASVVDVWYNGVRQAVDRSGRSRVNRIIVGQSAR